MILRRLLLTAPAAVALVLAACAPQGNSYYAPAPPPWAPAPQSPSPGQWTGPPSPAPAALSAPPPFPGLPAALPQFPALPPPSAWWPQAWGPAPNLGLPPGVPVPALPNGPPSANDPAQHCVEIINQYRAGVGVAPLARWSPAEPCAASQGQDGSQTGKPHGAFGRCGEMAQNVCPNWPGPADAVNKACLKSMYDEGPGVPYEAHGHYLNMTSANYTKVACGYYTLPNGSIWAVHDFQ